MKEESHSHTQILVVGSTERGMGKEGKLMCTCLSVQLVVRKDEYPVPEVESWSSLKRSIGHGEGYLPIHHLK